MRFVLPIVGLCISMTVVYASKAVDNPNDLVICAKRHFVPNNQLQNGIDSLDLLIDTFNKPNGTNVSIKELRPKFTVAAQPALSYQKVLPSPRNKNYTILSNEQVMKDKLTALREKQHIVPSIEAVAVAAFLTGRRGAIKVPK